MAYNTRLLRVSSSDAFQSKSRSHFSINIGNVAGLDECKGVSVECIGFCNGQPNVSGGEVWQITGGGAPWALQEAAIARGQYTFDQLSASLVTSMSGLTSITLTSAGYCKVEGDANFQTLVGSGWQLLGFDADQLSNDVGDTVIARWLPSLAGLTCAYLHSDVFSGKGSLDGTGSHASFVTHVPITSAYGEINIYTPQPHVLNAPSIAFPHDVSARQIDFSLQTHEGKDVDVGSTDMFVITRLWF